MSNDSRKPTTADRLRELLRHKDAELDAVRAEAETLRRQKDYGFGWALPVPLPSEQALPVPRVEAYYAPDRSAGWRRTHAYVRLVLPDRTWATKVPDVQAHPLTGGRSDGGRDVPPKPSVDPTMLPLTHVIWSTQHTAAVLNVPAYLVIEGVGGASLSAGAEPCACVPCGSAKAARPVVLR